jgi:hypothetical protein
MYALLGQSNVKMAVFWDGAPCSLALTMEAISTSETLANFYKTKRRSVRKTRRRENLKYHKQIRQLIHFYHFTV